MHFILGTTRAVSITRYLSISHNHYRFTNCVATSTTEITCAGELGTTFFQAEFSCAPIEGQLPGAEARLFGDQETCLGGTPESGTWLHGIQLFLMCDNEPQAIGICDPVESVGATSACSLGYTCAQGGCTAETLTIPNISSSIQQADCSSL